jgi:hypothetical protein
VEKTVALSRETMDKLFNFVPAGLNEDQTGYEWDAYWWCVAGQGGEGYYMIWENGETHHTYHNPGELYS